MLEFVCDMEVTLRGIWGVDINGDDERFDGDRLILIGCIDSRVLFAGVHPSLICRCEDNSRFLHHETDTHPCSLYKSASYRFNKDTRTGMIFIHQHPPFLQPASWSLLLVSPSDYGLLSVIIAGFLTEQHLKRIHEQRQLG